jgi:hypothetical protein
VCAPLEEIDTFVSGHFLELHIEKSWANLAEVESGDKLKSYWQYIFYERMSLKSSTRCAIKMMQEILSLEDSFWFHIPFLTSSSEEIYSFFNYESLTITEKATEGYDEVMHVEFLSTDEILQKKRKV